MEANPFAPLIPNGKPNVKTCDPFPLIRLVQSVLSINPLIVSLEVFSECYQSSESRSFNLLIRQSLVWGEATCLEMATAADARLFFSHDGLQVCIKPGGSEVKVCVYVCESLCESVCTCDLYVHIHLYKTNQISRVCVLECEGLLIEVFQY